MKAALVLTAVLLFGHPGATQNGKSGQNGAPGASAQAHPFKAIPTFFLLQTTSVGDRVRVTGKELTVYTGDVVDSMGHHSPGRVTYQLNGAVKLEGFNGNQGALSFDGKHTKGAASSSDNILLEVFLVDTVEGVLNSVQNSAAVRPLGLGIGPDPRTTPNYVGPRYDVFEVTAPVPSSVNSLIRTKLYYFDTHTGLLASTQYYDRSQATPLKMETRFSNWQVIDGSEYAGEVDHYEAGQLVFSFIVSNTTAGPGAGLAPFQ